MPITLETATPDSLDEIVEEVALWQQPGAPVQVHPGDFGWNWCDGAETLAAAVRAWRRDGQIVAAGMVDDDSGLIRMAIAPSVDTDEGFSTQLLADLSDPAQGVLPADAGFVEARAGTAFRELLHRSGWVADEPWTPLSRDLSTTVEDCGLTIEYVDAQNVRDRILEDRIAVHRAAFPNAKLTLERWQTMAAGAPYRRGRCLVGYDTAGNAVAAATVWSAGEGRPGLIEPLGAHRDYRGRGHGRAITVAAASALQELGSSSATVCTPSSNVGGVAAYVSAGFEEQPAVTDFRRKN
ncbi:GNAT family N-acetyltransferase [Kribbella karoonensis]|uniref:N-acetyltransferase domain-containing protein n=1 Tax=Kribbella karoonensis TaxID=324851 RepID=A0ABP4PY89_9ACTN